MRNVSEQRSTFTAKAAPTQRTKDLMKIWPHSRILTEGRATSSILTVASQLLLLGTGFRLSDPETLRSCDHAFSESLSREVKILLFRVIRSGVTTPIFHMSNAIRQGRNTMRHVLWRVRCGHCGQRSVGHDQSSAVRPAFRINIDFVGVNMESKVAGDSNEDIDLSLALHASATRAHQQWECFALTIDKFSAREAAHALHIHQPACSSFKPFAQR